MFAIGIPVAELLKEDLTSCQTLFNSISSYLTFYINDTPSLKINIMLKLFQTSSTGTIWKYTGSPRWSSCFLRRQITFFFSSRIRLKPFILKYTLHFSFSQNLRNHKRTPYSPSADRWQDVSHQSSHIFPVLSNILSVHTAHLTSHSFHLIISWISLRFTHRIPGYPGEFPFVSKNPKQLNICFFVLHFHYPHIVVATCCLFSINFIWRLLLYSRIFSMDMNKMLCFMDNFILFSFSVCCSGVLKQKSLPTYDVVVTTQYASRQTP